MKYYTEKSLKDFDFWSGARDRVDYLTNDELDQIEALLEESAPDEGYSGTDINDFFWFEEDTIAEWLGYNSFEEIEKRDDEDEEEDETETDT